MADITPLVSADWLAQRLGARDLLLIDIRSAVDGGGKAAYLQAHVPGAVHTDYAKDGWRATKGMATGLLPDPDFLAKLFGGLGLDAGVARDHHFGGHIGRRFQRRRARLLDAESVGP